MELRHLIVILLLSLTASLGWTQPAPPDRAAVTDQMAQQLVNILADTSGRYNIYARTEAARTLGELGPDARVVVPQLIGILSQPFRPYPVMLDEALVIAVGKIGAPARSAIPALVQNTGRERDLDRAITDAVLSILRAPDGPASLAEILRGLKDVDPADRLRALKRLSELGPEARVVAPQIVLAMGDRDPLVRRLAVLAYQTVLPGQKLPEEAVGVFVRDLQDPDDGIRLRAVKVLGQLGQVAASAVPALQAIARNDPDVDVRRIAGDSLFRITGR